MDVGLAIRERRSVRAFLPDEVPEKTIRRVLDTARWAPSWANTQAWNVHVVTGEPLARIKRALAEKSEAGEVSAPDIEMPRRAWPDYLQRRMSVRRPETESPPAAGHSAWDAYGAPCLLLFSIDETLVPAYACLDTGLLVQSVCLAAQAEGLGSVIMAMVVRYPEVLHETLPGTEGTRFVVGVALGRPDPEAAANRAPRSRADLDKIVTWVG